MELLNCIFETKTIPKEWKSSTLIPIFNNKGDIQECSNGTKIELMLHFMKPWERVIEKRIREEVTYSDEQFGFMPGRSTTDAAFALRELIKKYR